MLTIQISDPEMEKTIKHAFVEFIQLQKVKQDVAISIKPFDARNAKPLKNVMRNVRAKYEQ